MSNKLRVIVHRILHEEYKTSILSKDDIINIQKALKNTIFSPTLGKSGLNKDGVDGIMNANTIEAIKQFQKSKGLEVTGKINPATAQKLNVKIDYGKIQDTGDIIRKDTNTDLYFDGKNLNWIENGDLKKKWFATTGSNQFKKTEEMQMKKDLGPIPAGVYAIDLKRLQTRTKGNFQDVMTKYGKDVLLQLQHDEKLKNPNAWFWNTGNLADITAWGNYRIPIEHLKGTEAFSRHSFYVHGGTWQGSSGCIDLMDQIDDFVNYFKNWSKTKNKTKIRLVVQYYYK